MLSYLYKKYLDWSYFYRNREPNQYGTTLYPRVLDDLPRPSGLRVACSSEQDLPPPKPAGIAKLTYREALLNNLKKV
jgi:hypothetical protein